MEKRPEEMWARIAKAVSVVEKNQNKKSGKKNFIQL